MVEHPSFKQMMNEVVEGVPYHLARVPGYHVGGKTGTTVVSIPGGYDLNSTIASFVGFAPVEDPQMIMLVKIDQPPTPLAAVMAPNPRPVIVYPTGTSPAAGEQQPISETASTEEGKREAPEVRIGVVT